MFARFVRSQCWTGLALVVWLGVGCTKAADDELDDVLGTVAGSAGHASAMAGAPSAGGGAAGTGMPHVNTAGTSGMSSGAGTSAAGVDGMAGSDDGASGEDGAAGTDDAAGTNGGTSGSGGSAGTTSAAGTDGSAGSDPDPDPVAGSGADPVAGDPNGPCVDLNLFCFDPFDMFILNPECFTCNNGEGCQECSLFQAI